MKFIFEALKYQTQHWMTFLPTIRFLTTPNRITMNWKMTQTSFVILPFAAHQGPLQTCDKDWKGLNSRMGDWGDNVLTVKGNCSC
jgi:hypothetical protein